MVVLTAAREKFVKMVAAGASQRQAYREAYPRSRKWKDSAVDSQASVLFHKPKVAARYKELLDDLTKKEQLKAEEIVSQIKNLSTSNVVDLLDAVGMVEVDGIENPELTWVVSREALKALPRSVTSCISSITFRKDGSLEIKLWDKNKSLEMAGKYLGIFTEKLEVSGNISIADTLREARKRALKAQEDGNPDDNSGGDNSGTG